MIHCMPKGKHPDKTPEVLALLDTLYKHQIKYVLIGSVAALIYGVDVPTPGDLDITPALDHDNLSRLANLLIEIEARLPDGAGGHWEIQSNGERKWFSHGEPTPEELAERAAWALDPDDVSSFDWLFYTKYGNFDVVPDLTGDYEALMPRAIQAETFSQSIWVAHVEELLAALTVPRRENDRPCVEELRKIQQKAILPKV